MRVKRIKCNQFLGLSDVDLTLPHKSGITAVTGSNGSGKTSLLKLINTAVARAGLGSEYQAGLSREWIKEDYDFSVELQFSERELIGFSEFASTMPYSPVSPEITTSWNGTLVVEKSFDELDPHSPSKVVRTFGEVDPVHSDYLVNALTNFFNQRSHLKSVFIDANRAYPGDQNRSFYYASFDDLDNFQHKRDYAAAKSLDAYNQILDYLSLMEGRSLTRSRGRSRTQENDDQNFLIGYLDPLEDIRMVLASALPHLELLYIDPAERMAYFKRGNTDIPFSHLSGGEREIVFIAAQMMRMKVNDGILLIDEPELHLNPELVRRLIESISLLTGDEQVFLATHSYEVVESIGADRTLLIERNEDTTPTALSILSDSPVTLTLTNTLGRVGFSHLNQTVVMVEGGLNSLRAAPRFELLLQGIDGVAVVKHGTTKKDVINRFRVIAEFAALEDVSIRTACIVDMDFDSPYGEHDREGDGVYQTRSNEIENIFLEPESLLKALQLVDPSVSEIQGLMDSLIDSRAGRWIWGHMFYFNNPQWKTQSTDWKALKEIQKQFERLDWDTCMVNLSDYETRLDELVEQGASALQQSYRAFESLRSDDERWRHCLGKELLSDLASKFGWSDGGQRLEKLVVRIWHESEGELPVDVLQLREFVRARSAG